MKMKKLFGMPVFWTAVLGVASLGVTILFQYLNYKSSKQNEDRRTVAYEKALNDRNRVVANYFNVNPSDINAN